MIDIDLLQILINVWDFFIFGLDNNIIYGYDYVDDCIFVFDFIV